MTQKKKLSLEYNLAVYFPDIIKEWDWEENGKLKLDPYKLKPFSNKYVNWICAQGHKWGATIDNRTLKESGCIKCLGRIATPEYNLAVTHPLVASQWHPTLNGKRTPSDVTYGSKEKVWWRCFKNHVYQAEIKRKTGTDQLICPKCTGHQVTPENSLLAFPLLLQEWNYDANDNLPQDYTLSSHYKADWICSKCGHNWPALIADRARGHGCPECKRLKFIQNQIGEKNHQWKGGITYLEYPQEFDYKLKSFIRERDNFICQGCGINEKEYRDSRINKSLPPQNLHVHHIDHNKKNLVLGNLITLCSSCNTRANHKWDYYIQYYANIMKNKYLEALLAA